jgi:hypothetical protein
MYKYYAIWADQETRSPPAVYNVFAKLVKMDRDARFEVVFFDRPWFRHMAPENLSF